MSIPETAQWMIRTWSITLKDIKLGIRRCGTRVIMCSGSPIAIDEELWKEIHTQLEKR
jgi:hypothetical protein